LKPSETIRAAPRALREDSQFQPEISVGPQPLTKGRYSDEHIALPMAYLPGVESTSTTRPPILWTGRFVCARCSNMMTPCRPAYWVAPGSTGGGPSPRLGLLIDSCALASLRVASTLRRAQAKVSMTKDSGCSLAAWSIKLVPSKGRSSPKKGGRRSGAWAGIGGRPGGRLPAPSLFESGGRYRTLRRLRAQPAAAVPKDKSTRALGSGTAGAPASVTKLWPKATPSAVPP